MEETVRRILSMFYTEREVNRKLSTHLKLDGKFMSIAKLLVKYDNDPDKTIDHFRTRYNKQKIQGTIQGYISRYGEVDGPIKYYEKNSKLSVSESALRKNGKTDEEIANIKDKQRKNSVISEESLISRYGEELGKQYYAEYSANSKQRSCWCEEFWTVKGLTVEEANNKVSEYQVRDFNFFESKGWTIEEYDELCARRAYGFTLEYAIEKYGEEIGIAKFKYDSYKGSDLQYNIEKYGIVEGTKKHKSILNSKCSGKSNSNIQIEFTNALFILLPDNIKSVFTGHPISDDSNITFNVGNQYNLKYCIPDIKIMNLVIEFDGDYWHSREETIIRDLQKTLLLTEMSYKVLRIKESVYNADKSGVIQSTIDFINNNINLSFKGQ